MLVAVLEENGVYMYVLFVELTYQGEEGDGAKIRGGGEHLGIGAICENFQD